MITKKIVLILGAGASRAYGFPLGAKLKAMIWNIFNGSISSPILWALGAKQKDAISISATKADIKRFNNALLLSPDYSIDSFLEHHNSRFREIGKIGIASCLLPLEKRNYLYDDWMKRYVNSEKNMYTEIIPSDGHWYQYLFNRMCEGCDFTNFADNKLSVITFNYDRTFEYYLLHSLEAKYGEPISDCAKVLKEIQIIHVYGSLGELPELATNANKAVLYDITQSNEQERMDYYKIAADSLRIIPEERGSRLDSKHLSSVPSILRGAERIYFLGFGFLDENMDKIFTETGKEENNILKEVGGRCYGTAMGMSPHLKKKLATMGLERIAADLKNKASIDPINFPDCNINDFLIHHPYSKLD
ncbi:MAG: hypothetical protein JW776_04505 [Candidatus Lokiarchaeota archaeon]|nr:hypothetical protein [Candidatus Lokiarchaeota archaeon]